MLRKLSLLAVVALLVLPVAAQAQFNEGDWEMSLFGTGVNDNEFQDAVFGAGGGLGYFLTKEIAIGGRQTFNYSDINDESSWSGSSRAFLDYHFDLDEFQPFIGAQGGFFYGQDQDDFWEAGPEAGVKYFVNATTFVFGTVEWQISTKEYDDSVFAYTAGIGFRF